eukprot:4848233-Pyramimonas_sp.AAC.1
MVIKYTLRPCREIKSHLDKLTQDRVISTPSFPNVPAVGPSPAWIENWQIQNAVGCAEKKNDVFGERPKEAVHV